jgi:glycosyltransferase involved in cell wall biosynthesis
LSLRVLHLTVHEHSGAGRAVVRIHRALRKAGVQSSVLVLHGSGADPGVTVLGPWARAGAAFQLRIESVVLGLQRGAEPGYRSVGLFGVPGISERCAAADVVHLHWIPGLLGIADVASPRAPAVWTFHDQWPMCGAEHYTGLTRPSIGYAPENRAPGTRGPDVDAWVWRLKRAHWKHFMPRIVCPSGWLAAEARRSLLFGAREVRVIPNPIDTTVFRPREREAARRELGLPANRVLLLFGAWSATTDARKGFHVLSAALEHLAARGFARSMDLVVFGSQGKGRIHGFETHWRGFVRSEEDLAVLYSACDALALPSLSDNFPNTAIEAMACGLPVVGTRAGGIPEIVHDGQDGLLAEPGDATSLADRLERLIADVALRRRMGDAARRTVAHLCNEASIAERYLAVYRAAVAS